MQEDYVTVPISQVFLTSRQVKAIILEEHMKAGCCHSDLHFQDVSL